MGYKISGKTLALRARHLKNKHSYLINDTNYTLSHQNGHNNPDPMSEGYTIQRPIKT
jgi:hypothetical protein